MGTNQLPLYTQEEMKKFSTEFDADGLFPVFGSLVVPRCTMNRRRSQQVSSNTGLPSSRWVGSDGIGQTDHRTKHVIESSFLLVLPKPYKETNPSFIRYQ